MAIEIERKFLLKNDNWKSKADSGTVIKQGYLNASKERTVRVRVYGEQGFLTIKGKTENISRAEFEYTIPLEEALELLKLCEKPLIEKVRYLYSEEGNTWEIDVFDGDNKGLEIAEIELKSEDQAFSIPEWLGEEVSGDPRYFNSLLIKKPFRSW